jgi:hypothetical protein
MRVKQVKPFTHQAYYNRQRWQISKYIPKLPNEESNTSLAVAKVVRFELSTAVTMKNFVFWMFRSVALVKN